MQPSVDKRVEILRFVGARNEAPGKNILLFVTEIRCEVEENPDIDSATGLFALIQLSAVNREH